MNKKWCPGLDLNQHASQRYHLKVVCLPFHHLGTNWEVKRLAKLDLLVHKLETFLSYDKKFFLHFLLLLQH